MNARWMSPAVGLLIMALPTQAKATPSSVFWAPSTPSVQPYRVAHVTYDTYFSQSASYPIDLGLEVGALPSQRIQFELGFDLLYPTVAEGEGVPAPIYLNAKLGGPEGSLFRGSPAWSAGIYAGGVKDDVTNYDVLHATIGRTFHRVGTLSAGGYYGLNRDLFAAADGTTQQSGVLAGWVSPGFDFPLLDHAQLAWDVQSGRNVFGATGGGIYLYFTPSANLLVGPVYFFEPELQPGRSRWMWSVQLDADLDFRPAPQH